MREHLQARRSAGGRALVLHSETLIYKPETVESDDSGQSVLLVGSSTTAPLAKTTRARCTSVAMTRCSTGVRVVSTHTREGEEVDILERGANAPMRMTAALTEQLSYCSRSDLLECRIMV